MGPPRGADLSHPRAATHSAHSQHLVSSLTASQAEPLLRNPPGAHSEAAAGASHLLAAYIYPHLLSGSRLELRWHSDASAVLNATRSRSRPHLPHTTSRPPTLASQHSLLARRGMSPTASFHHQHPGVGAVTSRCPFLHHLVSSVHWARQHVPPADSPFVVSTPPSPAARAASRLLTQHQRRAH